MQIFRLYSDFFDFSMLEHIPDQNSWIQIVLAISLDPAGADDAHTITM
jgi:hypothetical protein